VLNAGAAQAQITDGRRADFVALLVALFCTMLDNDATCPD
jgi:hypothetical protein